MVAINIVSPIFREGKGRNKNHINNMQFKNILPVLAQNFPIWHITNKKVRELPALFALKPTSRSYRRRVIVPL